MKTWKYAEIANLLAPDFAPWDADATVSILSDLKLGNSLIKINSTKTNKVITVDTVTNECLSFDVLGSREYFWQETNHKYYPSFTDPLLELGYYGKPWKTKLKIWFNALKVFLLAFK